MLYDPVPKPVGKEYSSKRKTEEQKVAYHKVSDALKNKTLQRPELCQSCNRTYETQSGVSGIQAHHHKGYDFPLDVVWLCIPCHRKADDLLLEGLRNGRAFLSDDDVRTIVIKYRKGITSIELARTYKTSATSIRNFVQGKTRRSATRCLDPL